MRASTILAPLVLALLAADRPEQVERRLASVSTRYYTIHTDLKGDALREVDLRMTKMVEEYRNRTRSFGAPPTSAKLPFYVFKNPDDYYAMGGIPRSAGFFNGTTLMAIAGKEMDLSTWHTIQHEGFHQYAIQAIGPELPIWLNEGLAEYFGEAVFTGDGFVSGVIPQWRLTRVQRTLKTGKFMPLAEMMALPHEAWNEQLKAENYDQAWAMVQFLAHGDNGKYQKAFTFFIGEVGKGKPWRQTWQSAFGDIAGFQRRWEQYWLALPKNPTLALYGRAVNEISTSFLARATSQGQVFNTFDPLKNAMAKGQVRAGDADWLPPSLGKEGAELAGKIGEWTLYPPASRGSGPRLVLTLEDGTKITGQFTLKAGRVDHVASTIEPPPGAH